MATEFDVIVIGAGQAGLAAGYYLKKAGARFTLFDAGAEIGESWMRRWDSLKLFTPAKYNNLPGAPFPGDGYSLPGKNDVATYLKEYASRFELPARLGISVTALRRDARQFVAQTNQGTFTATSIIVATGAYHRPHIPSFSSEMSSGIAQLHSSDYRNPAQLPSGEALVVGAGNSGAQIAIELAQTRRVWLSGRDTGSIPRTFLGRDIYDWLRPTVMRPTVDSVLGRRLMAGRLFAGDPLVGITPRDLAIPGLTRVGRTTGSMDGQPQLEDRRVLGGVRSIVWCTGFRPDFGWIQMPIFGSDGYPVHRRGVVAADPRLAFLGLRYQSRVGSSLLGGVGEDAEYVVDSLLKD
jgi:putative flavoprotein involved in K+ transport